MNNSKKFPDFSVLMSVYKKENPKFLDEALRSIEKQTILPKEIILVEDGAIPKKLEKIIKKHQQLFTNSFKIIRSPYNRGLGNALRLGTNYITTNWIARMDSDDISVPKRFEIQLKEIVKNPKLAVIGGQAQEFAGKPSNVVGYRRVPTKRAELRRFIKWRNPFNHPSVMINKLILQEVGGYVPYGNLEDYYLWARVIARNFNVSNSNQTLVMMRVDAGLYKRRGYLSNIKYFYKLHKFLYMHNLINKPSWFLGDLLEIVNILMPRVIRKLLYNQILHRKQNKN